MQPYAVSGNIVDVLSGVTFPGTISVADGLIQSIEPDPFLKSDLLIHPGFINSHVHIESSKMSPAAFGIEALRSGVLGTVSDPHEIANVCGEAGMYWMLENAKLSPIETIFGVPPCIPAAGPAFETNGALFTPEIVIKLLETNDFPYLAEVMNYPGVIRGDSNLGQMISAALRLNLPVDGHAPGLRGLDLMRYHEAGITTDHECFTYEEALEKANLGMKILIREGSAAKNYDAVIPILQSHPNQVMFCTDDSEPGDLRSESIDSHVRRAIQDGFDPMDVFRAACLNPVQHYGFALGLLQKGDPADFVVSSNDSLEILKVYRKGKELYSNGLVQYPFTAPIPINNFKASPVSIESLQIPAAHGAHLVRVMRILPGQLITEAEETLLHAEGGHLKSDPSRDIIKIVVLNRYDPNAKPQVAFVAGLGLKHGACASTVAHDSHNIVAVGVDDRYIVQAMNLVIESQGGQSFVNENEVFISPLNVAGLMSTDHPDRIINSFTTLESHAKGLGAKVPSIFMALSFLSLLVIPKLKLSDKVGLFDVERFEPVSLLA